MPTVMLPVVRFEIGDLKPFEQQVFGMLISLLERSMLLDERLRAAGLSNWEPDAPTRRVVAEKVVNFMVDAFPDQVFSIETRHYEWPPSPPR